LDGSRKRAVNEIQNGTVIMITPRQNRRNFLKLATAAVPAAMAAPTRLLVASAPGKDQLPSYLRGYESLYAADPRAAAVQWFRDARFGLFLHYGVYSQLKQDAWMQFFRKIYVAEYTKLKDTFNPAKFDADFITDLALSAGMRYVNITTRHHDSFCLFNTGQTDFNSVNSPVKRDLVGELAEACRRKDLGLCLYYSHGRDWRHPHAPNNDRWGGDARPKYAPLEPSYAYGQEHDLQKYLDFMTAQITELLTNYGPVAAIWLDGIAVPLSGDKTKFRCQELYDHIHRLQPQVLVSYKQGLLGSEDFFAPEIKAVKRKDGKPMEVCDRLQQGAWGYRENAPYLSATEVLTMLETAERDGANLLLNIGPPPDGSIPPNAAATLRAVGKELKFRR
jgi:alpha-L-fucosidase